jgi:hypothetical protein
MPEANQTRRQIVALRAQRDALANVVLIAWAQARDGRHIIDDHGAQMQMPAAGPIEETEYEARAWQHSVDPYDRLTEFGREAREDGGPDGAGEKWRYRL